MKTLVIGAVFLAAAQALPASAQAVTPAPEEATMVCRPAASGEHATAQMMSGSKQELVCKPLGLAMKMSNGSMRVIGSVTVERRQSPDLATALTPEQINDAWVRYLERTFSIMPSP